MQDIFSIAGKVALVTGGSRGIGEMIAAGFLASGAKVYISSRKADVCAATAQRLAEQHGGECISVPADLSALDGINAVTAAIGENEAQLDVLVNNAGATWGAPLGEVSRAWLGQGDGYQRQGHLLPHPKPLAVARSGGNP